MSLDEEGGCAECQETNFSSYAKLADHIKKNHLKKMGKWNVESDSQVKNIREHIFGL